MQVIKNNTHTHTSKANTCHLTFEKIIYIYDEAGKIWMLCLYYAKWQFLQSTWSRSSHTVGQPNSETISVSVSNLISLSQ